MMLDCICFAVVVRNQVAGLTFDKGSRYESAPVCGVRHKVQNAEALFPGQQIYIARVHVDGGSQTRRICLVNMGEERVKIWSPIFVKGKQDGGDSFDLAGINDSFHLLWSVQVSSGF